MVVTYPMLWILGVHCEKQTSASRWAPLCHMMILYLQITPEEHLSVCVPNINI